MDESKALRGCFAVSGGSGTQAAARVADEMLTALRNVICSYRAAASPWKSKQDLINEARKHCESMCAVVVLRGTVTLPYVQDVIRYALHISLVHMYL
jgi:hypothetical protein